LDKIIYQKIEKNKNNHWWFKSRRKIFRQILKAINLNNPVVLDYGCGAGANLTLLKKNSISKLVFGGPTRTRTWDQYIMSVLL
jgi:hypothetical protein